MLVGQSGVQDGQRVLVDVRQKPVRHLVRVFRVLVLEESLVQTNFNADGIGDPVDEGLRFLVHLVDGAALDVDLRHLSGRVLGDDLRKGDDVTGVPQADGLILRESTEVFVGLELEVGALDVDGLGEGDCVRRLFWKVRKVRDIESGDLVVREIDDVDFEGLQHHHCSRRHQVQVAADGGLEHGRVNRHLEMKY